MLRIFPVRTKTHHECVGRQALVRAVGLSDEERSDPVSEQLAGTLSGGERQMLALGRALMAGPKLLLLDEPSLCLSPRIVQEIFRVIGDLRRNGASVLLVEQTARAALKVADYGYVLETGTVTLQGAARELESNQRIVETYLGKRKAKP